MLLALTPKKIRELFAPIIKLAIYLKNRASRLQPTQKPDKSPKEPLITVSMIPHAFIQLTEHMYHFAHSFSVMYSNKEVNCQCFTISLIHWRYVYICIHVIWLEYNLYSNHIFSYKNYRHLRSNHSLLG